VFEAQIAAGDDRFRGIRQLWLWRAVDQTGIVRDVLV
jgi:hypothetical protein